MGMTAAHFEAPLVYDEGTLQRAVTFCERALDGGAESVSVSVHWVLMVRFDTVLDERGLTGSAHPREGLTRLVDVTRGDPPTEG